MKFKNLEFTPAIDRPDLVSLAVSDCLNQWQGAISVRDIQVAEIDPNFAGGIDFCAHYGVPIESGVNCVIVEATRGSNSTIAACLAPVKSRIDFNGVVRRTLNARRVSLAPRDRILEVTGMEYGSITPIGLPRDWVILLDQQVVQCSHIVVGSGLLKAKICLPTNAVKELPSTKVVQDLAIDKSI